MPTFAKSPLCPVDSRLPLISLRALPARSGHRCEAPNQTATLLLVFPAPTLGRLRRPIKQELPRNHAILAQLLQQ